MADYPLTDVSTVGLVLDVAPGLIPPEGWTYGENVKFSAEGVSRQWGDFKYMEDPLPEPALCLLASPRLEINWYTIAICKNSIQMSLNGVHNDISPLAGWTLASDMVPTGCVLNNVPCMNHPDYSPMFWQDGLVAEATPLPGLDASIRFNVLRAFGNFLVGIGVKDIGASDFDSNRIMWSTAADPGTVPPTWAPVGSLAGSAVIANAQGDLIDCLPLGNVNYIYGTSSVHSMQFVGGQYVFKLETRFPDFGILAPNCVASFKNYHFVVTSNDFVIHNGVSWESVGTKLVRRYFKENLDPNNYQNSFVVVHESQKEIWVFFPTIRDNSTYPTEVLVWNWETKVWGIRSCSPATCGTVGYIKDVVVWSDPGLLAWNTNPDEWSSLYTPTIDALVMYGDTNGDIQSCPPIMTRNGVPFTTVIERKALAFEGLDRFRKPIADPRSHKLILEVWPILRYINDTVQIYVGGQDDYDAPIYWQGPFDFNPVDESFIVPAISGKFISFRLEYSGNQDFLFEGYTFKFEEVGIYVG